MSKQKFDSITLLIEYYRKPVLDAEIAIEEIESSVNLSKKEKPDSTHNKRLAPYSYKTPYKARLVVSGDKLILSSATIGALLLLCAAILLSIFFEPFPSGSPELIGSLFGILSIGVSLIASALITLFLDATTISADKRAAVLLQRVAAGLEPSNNLTDDAELLTTNGHNPDFLNNAPQTLPTRATISVFHNVTETESTESHRTVSHGADHSVKYV